MANRTKTEEITAAECGKRLGLTAQAIGLWVKRSGAPARADGTRTVILWPDFARWREQELVKQAKQEAAPVSLDEARTRKALAEAVLAEIAVEKARGEVVAVADYETALARILDRLTARLRGLSVRFSDHGAEVEAAIEAEVERIITELHAWDEDVIDEPEPDGEVKAA